MRLTLRTLLAYLDDTLSPAETKQIGQKVAESESAQELIARIKQVTRRRRLTTPPLTGPGARFEPDVVAAYLDNALPPDEVAEVEKTCLESDVHLAEIATCHQILALVLGEPVLVPPTAKRRMYALVQGKEAAPGRKAKADSREFSPAEATAPAGRADDDEALLMGLPLYGRQSGGLRWLLPLAGLFLLAALGVAVFLALRGLGSRDQLAARPPSEKVQDKKPDDKGPSDKRPDDKGPSDKQPKDTDPADKTDRPWLDTPDKKRVAVGKHGAAKDGLPVLLLQRRDDKSKAPWQGWERVKPDGVVSSNDSLVALPGSRADVELTKGVGLCLWGSLPQFAARMKEPDPRNDRFRISLYESAVTVHPSDRYDLDFTLHRGRVLLTNRKKEGEASVRIRVYDEGALKEVWNVTLLEPETEVGVERLGLYLPLGPGEDTPRKTDPFTAVNLLLLKGSAGAQTGEYRPWQKLELRPAPEDGPLQLEWDTEEGKVKSRRLPPERREAWARSAPPDDSARPWAQALKNLDDGLKNKAPDVALDEALDARAQEFQSLAVLGLGAIDWVEKLVDVLDSMKATRNAREDAVVVLQNWLGRKPMNDKELLDKLAKKGFSANDAQTVVQLLAGYFTSELRRDRETLNFLVGQLSSRQKKVAIRQLAYLRLWKAVPEGDGINYNPAGSNDELDRGYDQWKRLLAQPLKDN